ncbi:hypothetical protein N9K49_01580 [Flavobacteriaceae bacterium]|nr:hypothetical protein [Flavobacteriaceae bacterium]
MKITISLLLLIFLIVLVIHLRNSNTKQNKSYLSCFVAHVISNLVIGLIGLLSLANILPIPVEITPLVKYIGLLFLYLFSDAIFIKAKPRFPKIIVSFCFILFIVFILNHFGFRLLEPRFNDRNFSYIENGTLTLLYRDYAVLYVVFSLITILMIIKKFMSGFKILEIKSSKIILFKRWFLLYLGIITLNLSLSVLVAIFLKGRFLNDLFSSIFQVLFLSEFLFISFSPKFLGYLPKLSIPKPVLKTSSHVSNDLKYLISKITSENLFLNPDLSLSKMAFHANLTDITIRVVLKNSKFRNFKYFVNFHRIKHACTLIDNDYLDKHTINSLSKECGYNSHQTFFRVFKELKIQTPLAYSIKRK